MNIQKILLTVICCVCALSVMAETSGRWIAWSLLPATRWEDAFVTGNGIHGTMVWGNPQDECITCVHEELFIRAWDRHAKTVPVTAPLLPEIRNLINLVISQKSTL